MDISPARFPSLIGASSGTGQSQPSVKPFPPFWNHGTFFKAMTVITSHSALSVIMVCYHHAGEANIQSRFYSKYQILRVPNGAHPVDMERSYMCISQRGKLSYTDRSSEVEPFKPIPIRPTSLWLAGFIRPNLIEKPISPYYVCDLP